jgi:hypothetical protein
MFSSNPAVAHHRRNNVAHAWSSSHAPENLAEQSCQEISVAASAAITFAGSSWGLIPAGIVSAPLPELVRTLV